jgi:hypothetical protein
VGPALDADALTSAAVRQAGLDDFGDIPYEEPLQMVVASLNRDAGLPPERLGAAGATLTGLLVKRLHLVRDRRDHPELVSEVIEAPIFIVGLPRSGSTLLHHLMGQVDGLRVPLYWEMAIPSPPPRRETYTADPRIDQVRALLAAVPDDMLLRHPVAADRPEQCNLLNDWSLLHQALLAYYNLPSYRDWLLEADFAPAFEAHHRTLQQLQWQVPGRWVLKYPKHLIALDALFVRYPDARIVWTHRDPAVVMPSVASLTSYIRTTASGPVDEALYGREWTAFEELVLYRGLAVRDRIGRDDERFFDIHYRDLMADPVGTVEAILGRFGASFNGASRQAVERFVVDNAQTRHGVHRYSAEQFGLDPDRLHSRFAGYIDRFGVDREERT